MIYCSPSLCRHTWLHNKVPYYPNVVSSVMWHFSLKCYTTKVFWGKWQFMYIMNIHKYERTCVLKKYAYNVPQVLQCSQGFLHCSLACFKLLITYEPQNIGGSHYWFKQVDPHEAFVWLPSSPRACGRMPFHAHQQWGNVVLKSFDKKVPIDSEVNCFHVGWHAMCHGCHLMQFMCIYKSPSWHPCV